ncbi:toll/interleukin-1 receptor domain-containing protein [Chondrinema litorale]|uniref:toll/interleukin-1 receptor domain-containing protein n=1 Tax=Chondrinema litorale TaxID=2994555 RepID=UPI002542A168|nr:toll/interleukin-1 receptor domain-containing protein [Chondrinema litorale]UZR94396.1 toll/interleukin-1 receptor domain-containing protein [Chondrinema litorale]
MKTSFNDIFISYGRGSENSPGSKSFSIKLHQILESKGFDVWLDNEDIPHAVDYQKEINEGIKNTKNFIFIISPHSVASVYCLKEVDLAVELNKRIIPILHITPEKKLLEDSLHPVIKKLNWVYFDEETQFDKSIAQLENAISTDQDHLSRHTEYTSQAVNWQENDRNIDLLIRGGALKKAEKWLKEAKITQKEPAPSKIQEEYIIKSRKDSNFRMFRRIAAIVVFILVSSTLSLALYYSQQEKIATAEALLNLRKATSNELIAKASAIQCEESEEAGLKVAALAYEADTTNLMAKTALYDAYYKTFTAEANEKSISNWSDKTQQNTDGLYAELGGNNEINIYNENGERYATFKTAKNIQGVYMDTAEDIVYAKTDQGETLAYHLNTDWILKNMDNKSVPQLDQKQLKKYGIRADLNTRLESKLSGFKSEARSRKESSSVTPSSSTQQSQQKEENTKSSTTQNNQPTTSSNSNSTNDVKETITNLFESKDRAVISEAFKAQLQKYQNAMDNEKIAAAEELYKIANYAYEVFPDQNDIKNALTRSIVYLANENLAKNNNDQAINLANKGLELTPNFAALEKIKISALLKSNNLTEAQKMAEPLLNKTNNGATLKEQLIKEIEEDKITGRITTAQQRFQKLLTTPLEVQGILINDRSEVTTNAEVSLKIYASGASEMMISNTPQFNDGSTWERFQSTKQWKLQQGQGKKTVYIKFKDSNGNVSAVYQQSILLTRY